MKKSIGLFIVNAMLVVFMAVPASAGAPETFTDSFTFVDVNPCTDQPHAITIGVEVKLHEHRNNFVVSVRRSGSTSDGYTMIAGAESFVENDNVARGTFTDQWRGGDGSKFKAQGKFVYNINKDELLVEGFSLKCIGNG